MHGTNRAARCEWSFLTETEVVGVAAHFQVSRLAALWYQEATDHHSLPLNPAQECDFANSILVEAELSMVLVNTIR